MSDENANISQRKLDHIDLCAEEDVESRGKSTLLEEVELFHDSLPEVSVDGIDLGVDVFGKRLDAPLLITGMTGGAERAQEINETLARVAQALGIAFGVGSQRAMMKHPDLAATYRVREVAPDIVLFGNIGAVQVAEASTAQIEDVVEGIGADALCVHLNPGQEMIQPEGDRDFRGCVDGIARLVDELSVPIIAKETGCGLGPAALDKLKGAGVEWVDTSGAGGTTWVGVETLRTSPEKATVGEMFWDWGVPTAAAISYATARDFNVVGSGGLRTGLDCARAIALGANLAGMALPWLKTAFGEGYEAALSFGETTIEALTVACLLTGSANIAELQQAPRMIGPNLRRWNDEPGAVVSPRH
jgi:isopentenyl-diphosphate delta-isomerase